MIKIDSNNEVSNLLKEDNNSLSDSKESKIDDNINKNSINSINNSDILGDSNSLKINNSAQNFVAETQNDLNVYINNLSNSFENSMNKIVDKKQNFSANFNLSEIKNINESFSVDSFLKITGDSSENNKEENIELMNIYKKIQEGYFYFFIKFNGNNPKFFCTLSDYKFKDVFNEVKKLLNIENHQENFYCNNKLIDLEKTIKESEIHSLSLIHD